MNRKIEITVGLFMVLVICSVLFLCFRVTDTSTFTTNSTYRVYAQFNNIGGLKARSPVKIGGVLIGRISNISLKDYKPYVAIDLNSQYDKIPSSSTLSIKTSGLLGEQFIDVTLGINKADEFDLDMEDAQDRGVASTSNQTAENRKNPDFFEEGFVIHNTRSAVVIEDLIGQFLSYMGSSDNKDKTE